MMHITKFESRQRDSSIDADQVTFFISGGIFMRMLVKLACISIWTFAASAAPIHYDYDARGRLVKADYGGMGAEHFAYDAANNIDMHMVLTDARYMKSFLFYLSQFPASTASGMALVEAGGIADCRMPIAEL